MYSIAFPEMFTSTRTLLAKDKEAVWNNLYLLLKSDRTSLLGDPFYGSALQYVIYENESYVLKDLIIDEIYTTITIFMPEITVLRKNIVINSDGTNLYCTMLVTYNLDSTTDLYKINLTES